MDQLPSLVHDLALILVLAGVVTLLFKKLRQPLILGYIVAGFICGPHLKIFPSVADIQSVDTWADIGVIFLMFTIGLDFSFKKLVRMGPSPVVAACTIIFCMIGLGSVAGHFFGWSKMNSLFLGGMLAMSSTTVIYKALDDMGLRQQKFASSVMGALVVEDMLGILLMVILSTLAVSNSLEGGELAVSLLKLALVLVVWFIVGIFLIPTFLRKVRPLMTDETLLILSLGLCFLMVVLAVSMGYSSAFGAFMMGSILAETVEAEQINRVVAPVKDLFGAIFFVSVGMLVDPQIIAQYWAPILILILIIIFGQAIFGTAGFLLSGQPLRVAMQCGFSMAQIGEFAFIIASLGVSLKVTDSFLYPVVVAVSVITTFFTPYMIRLAPKAYTVVEKHLPARLESALNSGNGISTLGNESTWHRLLMALLRQTVAYSFLCVAVLGMSLSALLPLMRRLLGHWPGNILTGLITFGVMSLFLRAIVMRKNHSDDFRHLWAQKQSNRPLLLFTILVRYVIASAFTFYLINYLSPYSSLLHWLVSFLLVALITFSRGIQRRSKGLEDLFLHNLRSREIYAQRSGRAAPGYARQLLTHDVHLALVELPMNTTLAGHTLRDLNLASKDGVMVASIVRYGRRINIPGAQTELFPGDRLQIIGSDEDLRAFTQRVQGDVYDPAAAGEQDDLVLSTLRVGEGSFLQGKAVKDSRLREDYDCMLIGFEQQPEEETADSVPASHSPSGTPQNSQTRFADPVQQGGNVIVLPTADRIIRAGDTLWLVGEKSALRRLSVNSAAPQM